jgi:hypothetical protein
MDPLSYALLALTNLRTDSVRMFSGTYRALLLQA